jgi:hypothetical protein
MSELEEALFPVKEGTMPVQEAFMPLEADASTVGEA